MIDMRLLNQFLITITPENSHESINALFSNVKEDPNTVAFHGINGMQQFVASQELEVQAAAVNGILTGIFMANASRTKEFKFVIDGYIEQKKRSHGEHVVDLALFKAKKGH